jgi:hypothetical protein
MSKSPERGPSSPAPTDAEQIDVQLSLDSEVPETPEETVGSGAVPAKSAEPRPPIEVVLAKAEQQQEATAAEISRRDDGAYSSPKLVREAIGENAMIAAEADRREVRGIIKNLPKVRTGRPKKRSYRRRDTDITDHAVRAMNNTDDVIRAPENPDADIDAAFGPAEPRHPA